MLTLRPAKERGHADHGWLDTWYTFSFSSYYDRRHMGFRALRVINDDRIAPGAGFPTHPHEDMEIITYVLSGTLEHKDSMGNVAQIKPGEMQRMSAGTGVRHSEYNPSPDEPIHLLQIWILPERKGVEPGYEQRIFSKEEKRGKLRLVVSPNVEDDAMHINQDVKLYATMLTPGEEVTHHLEPQRHAWIHVATGEVELNGKAMSEGDGAAISNTDAITLRGTTETEVLLFDLA